MTTTNLNCLFAKALNKKYEFNSFKKSEFSKIKELLKTDYSEAFNCFKNNRCIYRGQNDKFKNMPSISTPNYRISENAQFNIYTRLFSDILPSWDNYPKRNHSFICTNNYNRADGYGDIVFTIFPKNGTKLGICPEKDIWYSFIPEISSLNEFNNRIAYFLHKYLKNKSLTDINQLFIYGTADDIKQRFAEIDINMMKFLYDNADKIDYKDIEVTGNHLMAEIVKQYYTSIFLKNNKNITLIEILDNMLNPNKHRFTLISIEDYSSFDDVNNEIWFDNEALFLPQWFNSEL